MENSYSNLCTENVSIEYAYENDFEDIGEFEEYLEGDILELKCIKSLGSLSGNKIKEAKCEDDEVYTLSIIYRNKDRVNISLCAETSKVNKVLLNLTYKFVNKVAEKFFLVTPLIEYLDECEDESITSKWIGDSAKEIEWKDVEELISYFEDSDDDEDVLDCYSWEKFMSVEEAKEMLDFMGITVIFPE